MDHAGDGGAGRATTTARVVVQKFGGSSVADPARIRRCAERVREARAAGDQVVVVVSAMGDTTDNLLALAGAVSATPSRRELDQLLATGEQVSIALMSMALNSSGHQAVSLTGMQCGIETGADHTRARIRRVGRSRLDRELAAGRIPVVAGFQGVTEDGEVTTLGRGGSDTTAVALAAAVGAAECEIYTDVDGVYTADPRVVPNARLKGRISYDEMMEAAALGAKVMHLRAVELGKKSGVPIRVLHSQRGPRTGGTLICNEDQMETRLVSTVALKTDIGRITLSGLPSRPGVQREVFEPIAAAGISVDDIIQNEPTRGDGPGPGGDGTCTIVFTVDRADLSEVRPIVDRAVAALGRGLARIDVGLAKVSAIGAGMQSQPGAAAAMFAALALAERADEGRGIAIANITTSEIKISCLIAEADGERALQAVHDAFGLAESPASESGYNPGD